MINIFNKIFKNTETKTYYSKDFEQLNKNSKAGKIFDLISKFSETSELRYVGGVIRKIINKEKVDDIDLATNLDPKKVSEIFKKNKISFYETGIKYGTITAKIDDYKFEITTLRKDLISDGRHAKVEFSENWYEDASRRDFTFNAIYSDLHGNLYDPFDGKNDLLCGNVKFIGDPEIRIKEDYLRILRYIRFYLNYGKVAHDEKIKKIIKQNINGVSKISSDRLLDELKKLILSNGFINLAKDEFSSEIISLIFPQLININIFKNINSYSKKILDEKDFIFIISLMIIDPTDNCEYFIYKYNLSNEQKKRIRFISSIFSKDLDKNIFKEKNLWKIFYFNGKNYLNDVINFRILQNKKIDKKLIDIKEFFSNQQPPKLEIKANTLIEKYNIKEGKELGIKLKEIEEFWIKNSFNISEKDIDRIVNN